MAENVRRDTLQAKIAQMVAVLEEAQGSLNEVGRHVATAGSLPPEIQPVAASTLRHCDLLKTDLDELAEAVRALNNT